MDKVDFSRFFQCFIPLQNLVQSNIILNKSFWDDFRKFLGCFFKNLSDSTRFGYKFLFERLVLF